MMPPKEATAATEITEIAMIPVEDKKKAYFHLENLTYLTPCPHWIC